MGDLIMAYRWQAEARHIKLNKYRVVKGYSKYEVEEKVRVLEAEWEDMWRRKQAQELERLQREKIKKQRELTKIEHEKNNELAVSMTREAEEIQNKMESILTDTISKNLIKFTDLKANRVFSDKKPSKGVHKKHIELPDRESLKYNPKLSLLDKLSSKRKADSYEKNNELYLEDLEEAKKINAEIDISNNIVDQEYNKAVKEWEEKKQNHQNQINEENAELQRKINKYQEGDSESIQWLIEKTLSLVDDPFEFERQIETEYIPDSKMLLINQYLPTISDLPNLKKVSYVKTRGEFNESFHTESYMNKKYDDVIYKTILQTLYIVFKNDEYNMIDSVVLNGKVNTIDLTTGAQIEPYILTISVSRENFNQLNLHLIDPKAWFKSSRGIAASKIATITPVAPILEMSKDDARFVDGYSVISDIDETINLASIDWQDFENLIREIFEKEFNSNGGEVKITQASRDGGVDAVVFDPDPIRGGKIVIQAKRYTNVVGVSAVRDLFGTVMNEGAMKGILVTTANYGNDAYNFAKGKPLTLLNGANLLAMLENHGHKAKIDIKEAKELFNK